MSTKKVRKFTRYVKGPVKILARARDFYVRSMTSCAGNPAYDCAAAGLPNLHFSGLPRSFSANSSYSSKEEDVRELMRIASARSLTGKATAGGGVAVVPRSRTVTIGRIDEDKAYEFGDDGGGGAMEVYPRSRSYAPLRSSMKMKREENQRKFHEALLKMLYPPPSPPPSPSPSDKENEEEEEEEAYQSEEKLMKPLNDLPEEEIENDDPSPSNRHDNDGGDDGKLTRAQRKRLRKRKLKEAAASCRRKIIGPLLPDDIDDHSRGGVEDMSNVVEGVRQNAAGDLGHGSVEGVSNAPEGAEQKSANNVSEEEASCSNKNKLKLKQRRKSKKVVVASEVDSINHHQS